MDIYSFIDSRDIREHLRSLDYQFNAAEAAFLVNYSQFHTLEEKFAAFRSIIDEMPDCAIAGRDFKTESIHTFLAEYIALQERKIAHYYAGRDVVYQYAVYKNPPWIQGGYEWWDDYHVFADMETCIAAATKETSEEERNDPALQYKIYQKPLCLAEHLQAEHLPYDSYLIFNSDWQLMDMEIADFLTEDHDIEVAIAFDKICFRFPTPFHRGDIVTNLYRPDKPIVLQSIRMWDEEFAARELGQGDNSAMLYYAINWRPEEGGLFFDDGMPMTYLCLEFYRKPLEGAYRVLQPVSYALKKNPDFDVELLCNTFYLQRTEAQSRDLREKLERLYVESALKETGVISTD